MAPIRISKKAYIPYIPMVLIGLVLLVLSKDLFHAALKNYSFYLSESLLFSLFWLLFVPFLLIQPKIKHRMNRLILPFILSLIHLTVFSFCVFLISSLFFHHGFEFVRTFLNTSSEYAIVCILVYSIPAFLYPRNKEEVILAPTQQVSSRIKVVSQNRSIVLDCKDILYVKSEKPYIRLVTKERSYLHAGTLKGFLKEKAKQNFIQIHRSTIVNTDFILSYSSRKNGDYDILLANQDSVRASRSFNKNFKPFFADISLA